MDEELEEVAFTIIASAGTARSCYIEAMDKAEAGKFEEAQGLLEEGQKTFIGAHDAHFGLIQKEAEGKKAEFALILMHAEDQLMSAEAFGILAERHIALAKRLADLESRA